mmetsp:Transcript_19024/g.31570  ORF Transcript_19024/g.31570 Transcript_19024/m.31570 type:complete len:230 (+) Transcript_19024:87-776(+)|eukprot:CAMPEP_0119013670 /NCGR_PEP_ID=MMETSP1176-20130426/8721_1 /TAXON_ID=265551 /ORGANISM="Synedropsis recta cf, Strain CCMP1620" /LENGTH=229 /DNA_ID=CAMNT_0006966777 /DNA_START=28 /DNA_END=717 /DNA_ORIENTATION=+
MKFTAAVLLALPAALAFSPSASFVTRTRSSLAVGGGGDDVIFGGNEWKPDSETMGSTDTGDYFPEGYDRDSDPAFQAGMGGSQSMMGGGGENGPQLPGMENLGADAVVTGGITMASEIPAGMEFVASSVPDQTIEFNVAASSAGLEVEVGVKPVCMTYEDFFVAFSPDSHPAFSVTPATGRMDRRGGEPSMVIVKCEPKGQSGTFEGTMVMNLPEDNSKLCYKIIANSQ